MPTWGEILNELKQLEEDGVRPPFDTLRRRYLTSLHNHTDRNTIIYMSQWTSPVNVPPGAISIIEEDVQGLMEVIHGLKGSNFGSVENLSSQLH